jgi:hypothetical protein
VPWLLVRVRVSNIGAEHRRVDLVEEWAVRVRDVDLVSQTSEVAAPDGLGLEALGGTPARAEDGPPLRLRLEEDLSAGTSVERWFRFGWTGEPCPDPGGQFAASLDGLRARLPRATDELRWHAALLSGGACADAVLGGHTLDQGSAYSYVIGLNGAARDPLQHALPLVYSEPDLALSVLRNTCRWAAPSGELPYSLDGAKRPWTAIWQPSDLSLWSLWLAAEYAAATGDVPAFEDPLGFHPDSGSAERVPLAEHLHRQFRFFVDGVGLGPNGHVRMRNGDWNDMATRMPGLDHDLMVSEGESVLNSAMAAWVLPVWAGLAERIGLSADAVEARQLAEHLRRAVAGEWTGRWFRRALAPGAVLGENDLWLEVQPWAILCGAATGEMAAALLREIDERLRAASPLGARIRWPALGADGKTEGASGRIWASINMTLIWAAARIDPDLAWDEWRRMSLAAHARAYPDVWEGTLSGPDAYNTPEAERPGRTWASAELGVAMQAFPVGNLHSHAQPLLAYLRLLGVEPTPRGTLSVGGGGDFDSRTFGVRVDGHGRLLAGGPVTVEHGDRRAVGGPGEVTW